MGEAGATEPVSPGASAETADTSNDGNAANDDPARDIKPSELLQWLRCVVAPATRKDSAALRRCPTFLQPDPVTGQKRRVSPPTPPSFDPLSRARSAHGPVTHHFPRRSVALRTGRQPVSAGGVTGVSLERARRAHPRAPRFQKTPKTRRPRRIFSARPRAFSDLLSLRFDAFRVTPKR